jgi:Tfp pilus assembly protein PilO
MSGLSARQRLIGVVVGVLLAVGVAWMFVVSPKRAEAARLQTELQAAQEHLSEVRLEERSARDKARRLPALPLLKRAMPDQIAMSAIIRDLNRLAAASRLEFDSITPAPFQVGEGFRVLPLTMELEGTFGRVSTFLHHLRRQVEVRGGKLRVGGRLYTIESLQLAEGESKFPSLKVTLTLSAFVYDQAATSGAADPSAPPPAAEVTP